MADKEAHKKRQEEEEAHVACANAPLCGVYALSALSVAQYGPCCGFCYPLYGTRCFAFAAPAPGEQCPVCLTAGLSEAGVPRCWYLTYPCGHRVCAECFGGFMNCVAPPAPEAFGCPSLAAAEDSDAEDRILSAWEDAAPEQYDAFNEACGVHYDHACAANNNKRARMRRCPLCRAEGPPLARA